ncbi:mitotic spindle assembly checkpoint protein MAD1-like isoform X2 [Littorina saxatilis]|uniref:mitotic spindle assembly checkpoint protein MAD1-like isoform X2 n=1 Tax=Littorina saxatilis TaxID=31220 RepID=UPI0038B68C56
MESPGDSTAVIRMRKDFDAFILGSGSRIEQPSFRRNLDAEVFSNSKSKPRSEEKQTASARSIRDILEMEKRQKQKDVELLATKSRLAEVETQLTATTTSKKRARIEFENDLIAVKSEKERELGQVSDLRSQIRQLKESEKLAKAELTEGRQEWKTIRLALEAKLCSVQRERLASEHDIQKVKEESWQQSMELKQEADCCLMQLRLTDTELAETKEQLNLQKRRVNDLTEQMEDFELLKGRARAAEDKVKELEEQMTRQEEDATVTRALRADIEKVPDLEKEVTRLRTENEYWSQQKQNALLLQEQLISMQRKLEVAEKRCQAFTELQVEHEDLKSRLQRWEALDTSGSRRPQSPSELSRRVTELQATEILNLEEKGQLQSSISALELRLREAKEQQQKTQGELAAQQMQVQQQNDLIKRLRRKLLLVTKERDSFKRILDSYESEMTVQIQPNSRMKELEEVLQGFQQHSADLESQLEQVSEQHRQAAARCAQLEQQCQSSQPRSSSSVKADLDKIGQLHERVLELEQELKKLAEEKEVLEMRIEERHLQGDYDPSRTKVLHFSMNPAAVAQRQRQQEVERLTVENERLMARVQLLEQSGGAVEDLTEQVEKQLESVPESKAIEELKEQLAKEELRKKRLVEAFKKTSQEFRETCYQLLGYKIDIPCTGQYRLANMYSESPHDYLLFKQGESGEIQMLSVMQ